MRKETGQGLVEYALILALEFVVVLIGLAVDGPTVPTGIDLAIAKQATPKSGHAFVAGEPMRYTLDISNYGDNPSGTTWVTDPLPKGVRYHAATVETEDGLLPDDTCTLRKGNVVRCRLPSLEGMISRKLMGEMLPAWARIGIEVLAPLEAGIIVNTASVDANAEDSDRSNNVASVSTKIVEAETLAGPSGGLRADDVWSRPVLPPARALSDESGVSLGSRAKSNDAGDVWESIVALLEHLVGQREIFRESAMVLSEASGEWLEVLIEHAQETENDALLDKATALHVELASGEYDAMPDALLELAAELEDIPAEVLLAQLLILEPAWIDSCWMLSGGIVPHEAYETAMQALAEWEVEHPGTTADVSESLTEQWEWAEQGNEAIQEGTAAFALVVEIGIGRLRDTGDQALVDLADQFETEIAGCGQ